MLGSNFGPDCIYSRYLRYLRYFRYMDSNVNKTNCTVKYNCIVDETSERDFSITGKITRDEVMDVVIQYQ